MQVSTTGFVFLQLKKRTVRMKVRAWLVRGLFHGCDRCCLSKRRDVELSVDELKKRPVRRKTKVRVWSSVGLVACLLSKKI